MQSVPPPSLTDGKLPVFVFPTSLTFYRDDQSTHKQMLTLYNPYDYALKFKVLSTAPSKYAVQNCEGTIKARCSVEAVVRHRDVYAHLEGSRDKFRILMTEQGKKQFVGKRDIPSFLLPTKEKSQGPEDEFESLTSSTTTSHPQQQQQQHRFLDRNVPQGAGPSMVVIVAAVLCILALMLPSPGEGTSSLPEYLHLSVHQKLIAAYILGLVTMTILRS